MPLATVVEPALFATPPDAMTVEFFVPAVASTSMIGSASFNESVVHPPVLVATKVDDVGLRCVEAIAAIKFAEDNEMTYVETSAKTNINVTELFRDSVKFYLDRRDASSMPKPAPTQENQSTCVILKVFPKDKIFRFIYSYPPSYDVA